MGSVVIHCPTIALAQSAFGELELSIELFKQATEHPVVKHGLVRYLLRVSICKLTEHLSRSCFACMKKPTKP